MSETVSQALLVGAGLYLSAGLLFALAFLSWGIDPAATTCARPTRSSSPRGASGSSS